MDRIRDIYRNDKNKDNPSSNVKLKPKYNGEPNEYKGYTSLPRPNSASQLPRNSTTHQQTMNPLFEVYDSHTLIVNRKASKTNNNKSHIIQNQQPNIIVKPHYTTMGSNNQLHSLDATGPKIIRHSQNTNQFETGRSLSATIRPSSNSNHPNSLQKSSTVLVKPHSNAAGGNNIMNGIINNNNRVKIRQLPANNKSQSSNTGVVGSNNNSNNDSGFYSTTQNTYDSLNRSRHKTTTKISSTNKSQFNSLPRKPKSHNAPLSNTTSIQSNNKNKDSTKNVTTSHSKRKPAPIKIIPTIPEQTTHQQQLSSSNDDNSNQPPINISTTLAKAGTHSPPIKRRSSSLLHHQPSPGWGGNYKNGNDPNAETNNGAGTGTNQTGSTNYKLPSRFATRSMINDIYVQKHNWKNNETYKKAAAEIFKENMLRKFGGKIPESFVEQKDQPKPKIGVTSSSVSQKNIQQQRQPLPASTNQLHSKQKLKEQSKDEIDSDDESSDETSTTTSSSHATDEQISFSSLPKDDIPLAYQATSVISLVNNSANETNNNNSLTYQINDGQKSTDKIGTVTSEPITNSQVDKVHLSDNDDDDDEEEEIEIEKIKEPKKDDIQSGTLNKDNNNDDEDDDEEIDTEDEYQMNNYSDEEDDDDDDDDGDDDDEGQDIEDLKAKFLPLYEIERLDEDYQFPTPNLRGNYQDNNSSDNRYSEDDEDDMMMLGSYTDHQQHSQSFRIETTSHASNVEVFVHKESLQKAKDYLLKVPESGILSSRLTGLSTPPPEGKRRISLDPHILLLDACLEPDFNLVESLIPSVPNISKSTIDGITALHNAVCSGDARLVLHLIQCGANVNASDADGWTPLHCSACCKNKQISKILVEHGASLFSQTISDYEIPSQKCNKSSHEDLECEEYLFWEQENLGVVNNGIVYGLFEYDPVNDDELPMVANQIFKVINTNPPGESGWFLVEDVSEIVELDSVRKKGMIPAAYVSSYQLILEPVKKDQGRRL